MKPGRLLIALVAATAVVVLILDALRAPEGLIFTVIPLPFALWQPLREVLGDAGSASRKLRPEQRSDFQLPPALVFLVTLAYLQTAVRAVSGGIAGSSLLISYWTGCFDWRPEDVPPHLIQICTTPDTLDLVLVSPSIANGPIGAVGPAGILMYALAMAVVAFPIGVWAGHRVASNRAIVVVVAAAVSPVVTMIMAYSLGWHGFGGRSDVAFYLFTDLFAPLPGLIGGLVLGIATREQFVVGRLFRRLRRSDKDALIELARTSSARAVGPGSDTSGDRPSRTIDGRGVGVVAGGVAMISGALMPGTSEYSFLEVAFGEGLLFIGIGVGAVIAGMLIAVNRDFGLGLVSVALSLGALAILAWVASWFVAYPGARMTVGVGMLVSTLGAVAAGIAGWLSHTSRSRSSEPSDGSAGAAPVSSPGSDS